MPSKYKVPGQSKPPRDIKIVSGRTAWNREVRNTSNAMVEHLGGAVTEPESMLIRRIAVLEAELRLMELQIAKDRHTGVEPSEKYTDLYLRITNAQRRQLEGIGLKRVPKDVTPSLAVYLKSTEPST